jgi:hypothetical protein
MDSQKIFLAMFYQVVKEVFEENELKYILHKTRLLKLFILTIDELGKSIGYDKIPFAYGWYRYGLFSYQIHQNCNPIDFEVLLLEMPDLDNISEELKNIKNMMRYIISKHLKNKFKMPNKEFDKYIHRELPKEKFKKFYEAVDNVNNAFDILLYKNTLLDCFKLSKTNSLKKAIKQLESAVVFEYMKEDREEALYYFTDSLMLFLDNYEDNKTCRTILEEMKKIFNNEVLSIIAPYFEGLGGNEYYKKKEKDIHKEVLLNKIDTLYDKIDNMESKYSGYFPTYEDLLNRIRNIKLDKDLNDKISKILLE